jgi:cystathionine beta-synthase
MLPLVGLARLFALGCSGRCQLFLELESRNPGGSIKDRIGVAMIEAAERDAQVRPGAPSTAGTASCRG